MSARIAEKYYYKMLNNREKITYDALHSAMLASRDTVIVDVSRTGVNGTKVIDALAHDDPWLFYVDFHNICSSVSGNKTKYSISYLLSADDANVVKRSIRSKVANICSKHDSITEKEKKLSEYLAATVTYDHSLSDNDIYNVKGALYNGKAVCQGIALAFKLMCDMNGIPCIYISGQGRAHFGFLERHGWNLVKIRGAWYNVDITWDLLSENYKGAVPMYYNVSDVYIMRNHSRLSKGLPRCSHKGAFEKKFIIYKKVSELKKRLIKCQKKHIKFVVIQFKPKSPRKTVEQLLNSSLERTGIRYVFSYHESLGCMVIHFR